jgi:UDP-N-acetylglucosamine 4,6-dehydratase/5-epimerase
MSGLLITGGTGTFGRALAAHDLIRPIERVIIYSRDEQKQEEMARELPFPNLRFMLGDVRDVDRLTMAMRGVSTVVHAAALKIVPKCEYDPIEAVKTNVHGAENVIKAAIDCGVSNVIALSTDKAVAPVNLYGATKLTAERLFIAANHLSGSPGDKDATRFAVVRYGNVANSRGSVIPLFKKLAADGMVLPITHEDMTRFWITIEDAVDFVLRAIVDMRGGEVFIPKMPSFKIVDLAHALVDNDTFPKWNTTETANLKIVGMRPGEKIHETLITPHDTPHLYHGSNSFVILPEWRSPHCAPSDFTYSSDANTEWLSVDDLRRLV